MSTDTKPKRRGTPRGSDITRAAVKARWAKTPVSDDLFKRMAAAAPRLTSEQASKLRALLAPAGSAARR